MERIRRSIRGRARENPEPERHNVFAIIPPDTLGTLPEHVLLEMPSEKFDAMTTDNLARLPRNVIIRKLSKANLERLPQTLLATLPPYTLENLSPTTLQYLPPETLVGLPPSTLAMLPPNCLSQLPTDTLRKLPRETLLMLPHSITRAIFNNETFAAPGQGGQPPPTYYQPEPPRRNYPVTGQPVPDQTSLLQNQIPHRLPSMGRFPRTPLQPGFPPDSTPQKFVPTSAAFPTSQATASSRSGQRAPMPGIPPAVMGRVLNGSQDPRRASDPLPSRPRSSGRLATLLRAGASRDGEGRRDSQDSTRPQEGPASAVGAVATALPQPTDAMFGRAPGGLGRPEGSASTNSISAERASWNAERQSLGERLRRTKDKMQEMERAYKSELSSVNQKWAAEKDKSLALEREKAQWQQQLLGTKAQLEDEKKASERRLQEMVDKMKADMHAQQQDHDRERCAARQDMERVMRETDAKHQQDMAAKVVDHREALEKLNAEREAQTKALEEQISRQKSIIERQVQRTDAIEHELRVDLEGTKAKYESQLEELKQQLGETKEAHVKEMEELRQRHEGEMRKTQDESSQGLRSSQDKHAAATDEIQRAHETKVQQLTGEIEAMKGALNEEKSAHQASIKQMREGFENYVRRVASDHDVALKREADKQRANLETATVEHQTQVAEERAQHATEMMQLRQQLGAELDWYKDRLRQEREEHRKALASQRADSADVAYQPAEADLARKFAEIKLAVQVVTEPFNLGRVRMPRGGMLDPTRFLEREAETQSAMRFLLQSAVWARVVDGFFSAPCGFGALGSGDGRRMLTDLYRAWLRLFTPRGDDGGDAATEDPGFERFMQDREANRWRSATFHSLLTIVVLKNARNRQLQGDDADQALLSPYAINQERVRGDILSLLQAATEDELHEEVVEAVAKIARVAAELALETGVHRALMQLQWPERGTVVEIGPHYIDCHDGDVAGGSEETVDLVVCPRFAIIGDGRGGFRRQRSIHPGGIYPLRTC